MGRKKPKPLLAEQGIVHLKHSFVQPTEESGLLKTVGGGEDRSALILSTGTYGYAIPISTLAKEKEDDSDDSLPEVEVFEILEETSDPEVKVVKQILPDNAPKPSTSSSTSGKPKDKIRSKTKPSTSKENDAGDKKSIKNPEELSVAELVRVIGGGSGAPLRLCDVVDDRTKNDATLPNEKCMDTDETVELEEDPEVDEFCESLGIPRNKRRKLDNQQDGQHEISDRGEISSVENGQVREPQRDVVGTDEDPGVLQSIADYYKENVNNLYYYSQEHNPFGHQRLEFGQLIDSEDASEYDQDYIQLARLAQRARAAAQAAAAKIAKEGDNGEKSNDEVIYDPLPMEVVVSTKPEELGITKDTNLDQFWDFVKEDPHTFDRWIYLIQYAEHTGNLNVCRSVYSAFLPLFPYCFGYWKRYSELEQTSHYFGRALAILDKGLEFIPLSVDLWLCYISLYKETNAHQPDYESLVRREYDRALNTCGMEFRSDSLWEAFIEWETDNKRLKKAFNLFRRLIQVPTRLYNRHWDNIQSLVRDHHPRNFLDYDEYEAMRKKGCRKLGFRYKPEPEVEAGEIRKTSKPEDKLMDYTKAKISKQLTALHAICEVEVNKRWIFEDKIKRPYFHTKPLDKFQLRNWEEYLNFEIQEKNHDRTVLLFERCVIACAHYEEFWIKYARYVENYHKKHSRDLNVSIHVQKSKINEEIVSRRETEKEEATIAEVQEVIYGLIDHVVNIEEEQGNVESVLNSLIEKVIFLQENDNYVFNKFSTVAINEISQHLGQQKVRTPPVENERDTCQSSDLRGNYELPHKSTFITENNIHSETPSAEVSSLLSVPTFPEACFRWQETVRDIYKRACIIHCAKKPIIRLQWAAYEEELGNLEESRILIKHVLQWFPGFLDAKLQLLDLERRAGNFKVLEELYEKYIAQPKSPNESSLLSNKYARYLFKELGKPDKALNILRKAIRKDKGNASLYSYVFDICYERFPTDRKGAAAALELAILSKDISEETKLTFIRRKMLFFQEHGCIKRVREAVDQLHAAEEKMHKIKLEEKRKTEEEEKEIAFIRSEAYKQMQKLQEQQLEAYPVPELAKTSDEPVKSPVQNPIPIEYETDDATGSKPTSSGPIKAQIITEGTSINEALKEGPELPYQKVPPPMQFIVDTSTYGYGSKHPDQKIMEHMAQKEYEKLESKGYPVHMKDTDEDKKYLRQQAKLKHSTKDSTYIVPPRETYSIVPVGPPPRRSLDPPAPGDVELKPPTRVMAILPVASTAPCVNIPDWFIKEGGELCLSESRLGFSILRYWPHFVTEEGNDKMFRSVRRHVKWHQKQKIIAGHWRYLHRLVSWLGPCDFTHNGMVLQKCEDWPPEVLDQLHRINQLVNHEFNACSLDLYRHGHDWQSWHSENLPAYGSNPPVAIVTLGSLRILEMKRKGPEFNYVRFPLFPGSLLLMEGVTQADWAHQIIKDPIIKDETLTLVFRIMHAIEMPEPTITSASAVQSDTGRKQDLNKKDPKEDKDVEIINVLQTSSTKAQNNTPTEPLNSTESSPTSAVKRKSSSSARSAHVSQKDPLLEGMEDGNGTRKSTKIVFHKMR